MLCTSPADELQSRADVMKADCASQLRAADALRAAIKQHTAASVVLAQARTQEDAAAARNVTTVAVEQQATAAKGKVCCLSNRRKGYNATPKSDHMFQPKV